MTEVQMHECANCDKVETDTPKSIWKKGKLWKQSCFSCKDNMYFCENCCGEYLYQCTGCKCGICVEHAKKNCAYCDEYICEKCKGKLCDGCQRGICGSCSTLNFFNDCQVCWGDFCDACRWNHEKEHMNRDLKILVYAVLGLGMNGPVLQAFARAVFPWDMATCDDDDYSYFWS